MHFANIAQALRYLRSEDGGSLRIEHTQVARAAKTNATRDGYAFTFDEPSSHVVASPARPQRTAVAPAPNLSTFGFTIVRCACCGANICGTKRTCSRCHRVVDEACMQLVERVVQCFSCTCRACGNELASHTVKCHACHFRVHPTCTTDGVDTWCAAREPVSPDPVPKARKFSPAWQLTRPWLRYDPVFVLMWCQACRAHLQFGSSVTFVQGTPNFKLFSIKEHENSGTHNVSVALWRSCGRVTSVIRTLPVNLQEGIMALFRTVYRLVQHYGPLTHLKGDADFILFTGGTIIPSYHSRPAGKDILRFFPEPFHAARGNTAKSCEFFAIASDSYTDRASKKEELFYVWTMLDSMMVTKFFSCQPLPSGRDQSGRQISNVCSWVRWPGDNEE